MKITVFGAGGNVGRCVIDESLLRGHKVTAVGRGASSLAGLPASITVQTGDVGNPRRVAALAAGQDVVINATRPASGRESEVAANTRGLMEGLAGSGARLLVVGGAASLTVPGTGGRTVIDDPRYLSPSLRHIGQASLDQYTLCRRERRYNWVYLSPPADLFSGERSGRYRRGGDELLLDEGGRSRISIADLAVALLDEIERPRCYQQRFTVAY